MTLSTINRQLIEFRQKLDKNLILRRKFLHIGIRNLKTKT